MRSFFAILGFFVKLGEKVEEFFGPVFLNGVGQQCDGILQKSSPWVVRLFSRPLDGRVITVEHRPDFQ